MSWDKKLGALNYIDVSRVPADKEILAVVDLTLLATDASINDIKNCAQKAIDNQVAALCILPQHLHLINKSSLINCATVVNFPTGNEPHHKVLHSIEQAALEPQLHEVDYVFPYRDYLAGDKARALSYCAEAYQLCQQQGLLFKVILETGALPSLDVIYQLSCDVILNGCDFLKTSTGKIALGASIPACLAMLSAIIDTKADCGIKLSGGIKSHEQALSFVHIAEHLMGLQIDKRWFRFGMSTLLSNH